MKRFAINSAVTTLALVALLATLPMAGCGSSGSSDSSPGSQDTTPIQKTPAWMNGTWRLVRLWLGYDVSDNNMMMMISDTGFRYDYPDCSVSGKLSMNPSLPDFVGNQYTLYMTSVDCPNQWDIPTSDGATDSGHIWSENNGQAFYRISDIYPDFVWIYLNVLYYPRTSERSAVGSFSGEEIFSR